MSHHFQLDKLSVFSGHLEELSSALSVYRDEAAPPELVDEIAVTAGEIMLLLAAHSDDELIRETLEDARRLRQAARTLQPAQTQLVETVTVLTNDVARIIHAEKRAA
jgi:hypothetical protein